MPPAGGKYLRGGIKLGNDNSGLPSSWWVIGIDAADWKYIDPLLDQGKMPVLERLISGGVRATLETVTPPYSAPAWTTFMTGCLPGKHGVFDFIQNVPGTYGVRTMHGGDRKIPPFWNIFSGKNLDSLVMNVPMTYPPDRIRGYMISGLDAPSEGPGMTHPPELWNRLAGYGNYTIYPTPKGMTAREYAETMWRTMNHRADIFLRLASESNFPLAVLVFETIDMMGHLCLGNRKSGDDSFVDLYLKSYEEIDKTLGRLFGAMPGDAGYIIVSDHGMRPIKKLLLLDQWLVDGGYMVLSDGNGAAGGGGLWSFVRHAFSAANRAVPRSIRTKLKFLKQLKNRVEADLWMKSIKWNETHAFVCNMQGVYINLEGRFPDGCVAPAEYESLRDRIRKELLGVKDPDNGEQMIERVLTCEEAYPGPMSTTAPDLYILWNEGYMGRVRKTGPLFQTQTHVAADEPLPADCKDIWKGTHSPEGIFVAGGPGLKSGIEIDPVGLQDIAPTILAASGLAVPDYVDGQLLSGIFEKPPEVRFGDGQAGFENERVISPEEEELQKERLRNLGYL